MQPVSSVERFLEAPIGRYYVGRTWFVWCKSATLSGSCMFGRLTKEDLIDLSRFMTWRPQDAGMEIPFDMISDGSRITDIDPEGYNFVADRFRELLTGLSTLVRKHAFVHGAGFLASVMRGMFPLVAPEQSWATFESLEDAFAWFGREDAAETLAEVRALTAKITHGSEILGALREHLHATKGATTLAAVARKLGRSDRALQRELKQAGVSFRDELARARIAVAKAMLLDTDLKLETIAQEVGCLSLSHFSRLFRRMANESPSEFRRRNRLSS
jgi:AraC-like DNA-binding protein